MHGRFANWEYIKLEKIGPVSPARYYPSIQSFFNATKGPIEQ